MNELENYNLLKNHIFLKEYDFIINKNQYDIGLVLMKITEHDRPHLKVLLGNATFKKVLYDEISNIKTDASTHITKILRTHDISATQNSTVDAIKGQESTKVEFQEKMTEKDQYLWWWFSKRFGEGKQLALKIEELKQTISDGNTAIETNEKMLKEWKEQFQRHDLSKKEARWEILVEIVKAIHPNTELAKDIEEFVSSLTNHDNPLYIQNKFFQYYLVSHLFKEMKELQNSYQEYEEIAPIYNILFDTTKNHDEANYKSILYEVSNDELDPPAHVIKAIGNFRQIAAKLYKLTHDDELKVRFAIKPDGSISLTKPYDLFPRPLQERLLTNTISTMDHDKTNVVIQFTTSSVHRNVAKYSFIALAQSLRCIAQIEEAEAEIAEYKGLAMPVRNAEFELSPVPGTAPSPREVENVNAPLVRVQAQNNNKTCRIL